MARNINRIVLSGRLVADVTTNENGTIAKGTIAVNVSEKQADGKWAEVTSFIDFKTWQKGIFQYLKKGVEVDIDGHLRQERWEGKDGSKQSKLLVYAQDIILGSSPKKEEAPAAAAAGAEEECPF